MISIKLQNNFVEITLWHGCSPVSLLHIFRTLFAKNTSWGLLMHTCFTKWICFRTGRWQRVAWFVHIEKVVWQFQEIRFIWQFVITKIQIRFEILYLEFFYPGLHYTFQYLAQILLFYKKYIMPGALLLLIH